MAFIETPRFPDSISYGASGGPSWNTTVTPVASGYEARNQNWSASRHSYDVSHVVHDGDSGKKAALIAFFQIAKGRANPFRFKDWNDFTVSTSGTDGVLSVITADTTWQMIKRYTSGATNYDRTITKPVSGTVSVAGGGTYTIDYTTGIVTKTGGANPTGWTGQFDTPVRFDTDQLQISIEAPHGYGHWNGIPLIEVRL
ncbi:MAG: DUF2460 domain-containing protein [Georgfuchsia sp.]